MAKETYKEKYFTLLEANALQANELKKIKADLSRAKKDNARTEGLLRELAIQTKLNTAVLTKILSLENNIYDKETFRENAFEYVSKLKKEIVDREHKIKR